MEFKEKDLGDLKQDFKEYLDNFDFEDDSFLLSLEEMNEFSDIKDPKELGLRYAIREIEKLLGELDFEITESQGAMFDLDAHFEEIEIYKRVINFLDPNYKLDLSVLARKTYRRLSAKQKDMEQEKEIYLQKYLRKYNLKDLRKEEK